MITTTYTRDLYTGDGSDTTFNISFDFQSDRNNIQVSVTNASGILTVQDYTTHYTISGSVVTFVSAPASGRKIVIELNPTQTQDTDFPENSVAQASIYEAALDRLTLVIQWLKGTVSRIIAFSEIADNADTLGTISTQNSNSVAITGGSITGLYTSLQIADGGTGASTASTARTSLGYGTISTQDANNVNITAGSIAGTVPNINGLAVDASPDSATDYVLTYDSSATTNKKVLLSNVVSSSTDLVTDTNPTLSGNLDVNGFGITTPSLTFTDILDEDTMSSNSATKSITQQSAKGYVDNAVIHANRVIISGGGSTSGSVYGPGATYYGFIGTTYNSTAQDSGSSLIIPITGTIRNLYFKTEETLTSGQTITVVVYKNGSSTTLTCTITSGNSGASDTTNSVAVTAGDRITLQITSSVTVTGGNLTHHSIELRY